MINRRGRVFIFWNRIENSAVNTGVRKGINRWVVAKFFSMLQLVTPFVLLNWNKMFYQISNPTNIDLPSGEDSVSCSRRRLNNSKGSWFIIIMDDFSSIRRCRGSVQDCFFNVLDCGINRKCVTDQLWVVFSRFYDFKVGVGFKFLFNFFNV